MKNVILRARKHLIYTISKYGKDSLFLYEPWPGEWQGMTEKQRVKKGIYVHCHGQGMFDVYRAGIEVEIEKDLLIPIKKEIPPEIIVLSSIRRDGDELEIPAQLIDAICTSNGGKFSKEQVTQSLAKRFLDFEREYHGA